MTTETTRYPETLLVFRKYRKIVAAESDKEGKFHKLTIYVNLCGDHVQVKKVMKTVVLLF